MSESALWTWLSKFTPEGQYSRIESHDTCPGFPDVEYQVGAIDESFSGYFELKFAKKEKKKIPFKDEKDGLHKSQRLWIRENIRFGGNTWIIADIDNWVFCIPGTHADSFNGSTVSQLEKLSTFILHRRKTKPRDITTMICKMMTGGVNVRP